jgi:Na+/melibiose symporter-like transporter
MYIVGGALTIMWAFVILFCLPPDPIRAKSLNERERYIAVSRLRVNNAGVRNLHLKKDQILEVLLDEKFWIVLAMGFLSMIAAGPVNSFIPLIVSGFGFNAFNTLLLLLPSGIICGSMILAAAFASYKFKGARTYVFLICELITVIASLLLWLLPTSNLGGLLFACYILPGFTGGWGVLMGILIGNAAGYTKRAFSSSAIYLGYCLGKYLLNSFQLPILDICSYDMVDCI